MKFSCSSSTSSYVKPIMFFKVYIPDRSSQQLQLPPAFLRRLNGSLPQKSVLLCFGRRTWLVDVAEVGNTLVFQDGWSDFVNGNSLKPESFLVFSYLGAARFRVQIYGQTGVKIVPQDYHYESGGVSNENQKQKSRKEKSTGDQSKPKYRIWNGDGIKNKVPDVPYISEYPHFKMGVLHNYIVHGSLNVPMRFARKYLKPCTKRTVLQASDNSWPITLTTYENGCCKISSGWLAFVRDNRLKVGDICVFELIDKNAFTFKVSIFPIGP